MPELVDAESAWPAIEAALDRSSGRCSSLRSDDADGVCLYALQVTTRSALGALAFHTGGLLIDYGWVRLFGAGHVGMPSLATVNSMPPADGAAPPILLIGEDVIGGKFAINGGGLPGPFGEVNLWAPDTLAWESLGVGHGDFVHWMIGGGGADLYESLRWPGWEAEVAEVGLDELLMLFPPPCAVEGQDTSRTTRRAVPRHELESWLASLAAAPDGSFTVRVEP